MGTAGEVTLRRLYALRLGYLVIAGGLSLTRVPELVQHSASWPLTEGVKTSMLVALSLLWFLGIRYPLQMLPVLIFEVVWKFIWMFGVALPLWTGHHMDAATLTVFYECLLVVIPIAVIPWRYVIAQYVTKRGDRWV